MSAEDCSPNKSLRTTIRVFLRTAEKKREASRSKEGKESEPATPIEAIKPALQTPTEISTIEKSDEQVTSGDALSGEGDSSPNATTNNVHGTILQAVDQVRFSHFSSHLAAVLLLFGCRLFSGHKLTWQAGGTYFTECNWTSTEQDSRHG